MVIKGFRVGVLLKKTFREISEDRISTLAASAAYNFFFSLFPLLLFLAPVLSLAGNRERTVGWLMSELTSVLPPTQLEAIRPVLEKVVFSPSAPGLMSIGLLLAAWSGSNIFGTLMGALNTAYDVQETRSWIKQQVIRLATFVLGSVIVVISTLVFLNGEGIADWIGNALGLGAVFMFVWKLIQFPLAIAGLVGLAFTTFYFLPDVKQHKTHVLVAALLTTFLWILATLLFRLYANHFPPNPAYGLIGGVIILLTWMFYTMFVVLIGGELASELHHGTGAIAPNKGESLLGRIVTGSGPGSASVGRGTS
ncbi:MAG TPA: YihY/virulence factor BrkB family protein [Gemmatimonadaceae bacterium]|jgi:membrane protein|nr:YihY/virulence factor BrkB family protein [Gemmatimonadaceae bacterium]